MKILERIHRKAAGLLGRQGGHVLHLGRNPLAQLMMAQAFAGSRLHRGMPRYHNSQGAEMDGLDDKNRAHVRYCLQRQAKILKCSVSDLAWAISPQVDKHGMHMVFVDKWENVEQRQWLQRKAQDG